ncbi:MAG: GLPGLI family protein [Chitinophagaceae bacterium]|nr:GLPGLI family protein [Chitinophagaceae bacterium]
MKRILFIAGACILAQLSSAQLKQGKIIYERKVNMHKRLTGDQESMRNMVPEFTTGKMQLLFSDHESIFKKMEEEEDIREQAGGAEEDRTVVRMGGDNEVYKNYGIGKVIELRELGPKKYIIEDSIRLLEWKLDEADTKTIKGYTCKKATAKNPQGLDILAWYTDQIVCTSGPEIFGGLPGMILELNIADGEIVFTPLEILNSADQKLVKAPTNGKKITRKEFQKMLEEQFGESASGGGPVIRIMRN